MHPSIIMTVLGAVSAYAQQATLSGETFTNDPEAAVRAASPQWHFDEKTCMPMDGTDGNGNANPGEEPDLCNELKTNNHCPAQPSKNGQNTQATAFPTYWEVLYCPDDKSWRVLYDLYFPKDTGHRHDWEWAIVKWVDDGSGTNMWKRDGMFFEHEGDVPFISWNDLDSTYTDSTDIGQYGQKGKNHPMLFVAKWHHSVWDTMYTDAFANTCPPTADVDYRPDDYQYEAALSLTPGSVINHDWKYGSADSYPPAFLSDGAKYMCRYGM